VYRSRSRPRSSASLGGVLARRGLGGEHLAGQVAQVEQLSQLGAVSAGDVERLRLPAGEDRERPVGGGGEMTVPKALRGRGSGRETPLGRSLGAFEAGCQCAAVGAREGGDLGELGSEPVGEVVQAVRGMDVQGLLAVHAAAE
jgi:hypothetical protein